MRSHIAHGTEIKVFLYHAIFEKSMRTSLVLDFSVVAGSSNKKAVAAGLKPFTISQPPRPIPCRKRGRTDEMIKNERGLKPNMTNTAAASACTPPVNPPNASQRGTSRV